MILRCDAPRKRDRFTECGRWFATVPHGSAHDRILREEDPRHADAVIVACECGARYAIRPPRQQAA